MVAWVVILSVDPRRPAQCRPVMLFLCNFRIPDRSTGQKVRQRNSFHFPDMQIVTPATASDSTLAKNTGGRGYTPGQFV